MSLAEIEPVSAIAGEGARTLRGAVSRFVRTTVSLVSDPGGDTDQEWWSRRAALTASTDLQLDLGVSSLGLIELACILEEALGVEPPPIGEAELVTLGSVEDLVCLLLQRQERPVSASLLHEAELQVAATFGRAMPEGMDVAR